MRRYSLSLTVLLIIISHTFSFSQPANISTAQWNRNVLDSLLIVLKTATEDSNKVNILHGIGFRHDRLKEYDQSLDYHNQALSLSQKLKLKKKESRAYFNIAGVYAQTGNYPLAIQYHRSALKIAEEEKQLSPIASGNNEIAVLYSRQGKYEEALQYFITAQEKWKLANNRDGFAFASQNIAGIYHKLGKYAASLEQYFPVLEQWKKGKEMFDSIWTCDVSGNIGNVYIDMGNYGAAKNYFDTALTIALLIRRGVALTTSYRNFGRLNGLQGNYAEALRYYLLALKEAENQKNKRFIADIHNDIGNIYNSQDNHKEALDHYKISLKIREEIEDKAAMIRIYSNIGNVYSKQKMYEDALKNHLAAKKMSEQSSDKQGLAITNYNIGRIYSMQAADKDTEAKLAEALNHQFASLQYAGEIGSKLDIAQANIAIGSILCSQATLPGVSKPSEKYTEGIKYLNKGLGPLKELGTKDLIKEAYFALSQSYEGVKDYKSAFAYATLYMQMKDSLFNNETTKKIEQIRLQFEIEKAQTDEKLRQQKIQSDMKFAFSKREDSLHFQQTLTGELLKQQTLLSQQQAQSLLLKQASLDLSNQQTELNRLAFLKTQAELQTEQSQRQERENELLLAGKQSELQTSQLNLQKADLLLKENQLLAEKRQRQLYIGAIILLLAFFFFILRNIKHRQKVNALIASEKLKLEKSESGHKMAELELQSLRTQLNPHFMFNSLNAIQELILLEDNENSHIYLSRFSELLRTLLDNATHPFIPLKKEIDFLKLYLSLENLRIPDLQYSIDIDPGIQAGNIMIPNMMLQPYIENAIWHGLSHKKENRKLDVRIRRNGDDLLFEIVDNGVGRKKATEMKSLYRKAHKSRGMELLSKRFNLLSKEYGADIRTQVLDLENNSEAAGTFVKILVPSSLTENSMQYEYDQSNYN